MVATNIPSFTQRTGGSLTREKFLLPEIRIIAKLRLEGEADETIIDRAQSENIFQYPTDKEIKSIARACLARLDALQSKRLTELVANGTPTQAKQTNIYAMMKLYNVMDEFMTTEIGERYETLNYFFSPMDMNAFMTRYQAEHDFAAAWSDATVKRIKSTLMNCLEHGEFIQKSTDTLLPVLLDFEIEETLRQLGDTRALVAFNCIGGF
ncbi:DUF1819 family protein [Anaerotardibacter muris]|uniref:DUF1819 family protein n=1 Tax=Anaerotardibacter muris TaxID=2941505 RepID=UPI00203B593C|nr:DUF1819 family protein [Anaerotardibacter muris]